MGFYRCQSSSNESLFVVVIRHILRLCVEHLCWHNCANIQAWLRRALRQIWLLIGLLSLWFAVVVWITLPGAAFQWGKKTFCFRQQDNLQHYWGWLLFETDSPLKRRLKLKLFHFQLLGLQSINKRKKKHPFYFHSNSRLADADTNCGGNNFMINWHRSK